MILSSGYPFWLIKKGLPFTYPKLDRSINVDVVVMGGGISGALVAYHLQQAGIECVVIDGRTIGLGSSCASTSLLQYELDVPLSLLKNKIGLSNAVRAYKLCEASIVKLGNIADELKFREFDYRQSLYYAAANGDEKFLKEEFAIRKENGFDVRYLDKSEIQKTFGFKAPAAILSASGATTNTYTFTHALLQHCIYSGMKIYDRTSIKKIAHNKDSVTLKTNSGYLIKTKKLIYATGYEVVDFIDKKIVDLKSTYACVSEQAKENTSFWKDDVMIWNTDDPYLYMRTTSDNRIIIGGRDEPFNNADKRDKLIQRKTSLLAKDFKSLFPDMEFKPEFSWVGTFGSTKDGLPYIGNYKKLPNSLFALGFGGNGITFSLIAAEIITEMIRGKYNPDQELFSFERK